MFLDSTQGWSKGHCVWRVFRKTLMDLSKGSIIQQRMYPEMNRMELTSHLVMSCGNYSNGDSDRPRLEYPLPQEHLILTHELQNVWDCCASISQNCSCVFWLSDYKDDFNIKEESTQQVSVEMLQYMSTFFKFKKQICHESYGTRERNKKNLCFVKTLVELHLVSCSIVLTVSVQYIRVRVCVRAWWTVCLCGMYVCMCLYV